MPEGCAGDANADSTAGLAVGKWGEWCGVQGGCAETIGLAAGVAGAFNGSSMTPGPRAYRQRLTTPFIVLTPAIT